MNQTLIFVTHNQNKVKEVKAAIDPSINIITLNQAGIDILIPEPHDTIEENALEKAQTIYQITKRACFAEDTGLFVDGLNGEPGVKSARYAGEKALDNDNIYKLLGNLKDNKKRSAHFKTVISLIINDEKYFFEGICNGRIIENPIGENGFGYDPVFIPAGAEKTFAQMSLEEKSRYSHRKKAVNKLIEFINDFEWRE